VAFGGTGFQNETTNNSVHAPGIQLDITVLQQMCRSLLFYSMQRRRKVHRVYGKILSILLPLKEREMTANKPINNKNPIDVYEQKRQGLVEAARDVVLHGEYLSIQMTDRGPYERVYIIPDKILADLKAQVRENGGWEDEAEH
jgi:hypothetical protein